MIKMLAPSRAPKIEPGQQIEMAFTSEKNNYQDNPSLQLIVKDFTAS